MKKDYISKKVDSIINDPKIIDPQNFALASTWIMIDYKGLNLKILDMKNSSSLADYYILGSTENAMTARSIADSIQCQFKRHKLLPFSVEGMENATWILLDFGDIIVHVFQETIRNIFEVDHLWQDNPTIAIPQHYYFSSNEKKPEENPLLNQDEDEPYY